MTRAVPITVWPIVRSSTFHKKNKQLNMNKPIRGNPRISKVRVAIPKKLIKIHARSPIGRRTTKTNINNL